MTLTLLLPPKRTTLVSSLASIFNLSFLARSSEMTYTDALVLIRVGKDVFAILI